MQTVSWAGSTYNIPNQRGDTPWSGLSGFAIAVAAKGLNTGGGNFTLLADVNFGASFGIVSAYFKSRTANIASAGVLRLANADTIKWRNAANSADNTLSLSTNALQYNGASLIAAGLGSIVNADINASAAIVYSKLALALSIVNGDISPSAAIARNKLAALTASRLMVTDGSGFDTVNSVTATEAGYLSGVTSAIQTQLGTKAATDLSNVASVSANVPMNSKKFTGLAAGSANGDSVRYEQLSSFQTPVQGTTTSSTSNSTTSYVDGNLTATITPTSASHRIKITLCASGFDNTGAFVSAVTLARGGTNILSSTGFASTVGAGTNQNAANASYVYIDSPASTSPLTYTVQIKSSSASGTARSNAQGFTQTIILEEIV